MNWSKPAVMYHSQSLAPSSLKEYNKHISQFLESCESQGLSVSKCNIQSLICDFLISKAQHSTRPESTLRSIVAALKHYSVAILSYDPIDDHMNRLIKGLIKAETERPRLRTNVMPIKPFMDLFSKWKCNEFLTIKDLRQKAITLLTLMALCRPSDLVPTSILKRSQLIFRENGHLTITFFGIKNDAMREGFEVQISPAEDIMIDPVSCLKQYIKQTNSYVSGTTGPLFIGIIPPYQQLSPTMISQILNQSIIDAGLNRELFSAKCFRPTGASVLFNEGFSSDEIRRLGRWKSTDVMFDHYVSNKNESVTNTIAKSKQSFR